MLTVSNTYRRIRCLLMSNIHPSRSSKPSYTAQRRDLIPFFHLIQMMLILAPQREHIQSRHQPRRIGVCIFTKRWSNGLVERSIIFSENCINFGLKLEKDPRVTYIITYKSEDHATFVERMRRATTSIRSGFERRVLNWGHIYRTWHISERLLSTVGAWMLYLTDIFGAIL